MESCTCEERVIQVHSDHRLGSMSAKKCSNWMALFDRAVSSEAVGRYHSLRTGRSSIARASPIVVDRNVYQRPIFHNYRKTSQLFAGFPAIRGKKGFGHDKQHWEDFLFPLRGTFGFHGGWTWAAFATRCHEWLIWISTLPVHVISIKKNRLLSWPKLFFFNLRYLLQRFQALISHVLPPKNDVHPHQWRRLLQYLRKSSSSFLKP